MTTAIEPRYNAVKNRNKISENICSPFIVITGILANYTTIIAR